MSKTELEKFQARSTRGPSRGIYQQILASLFVKASRTNDPSVKISAICEAAESETATAFDVFAGTVFPLFLSILPFAWSGVLIYYGVKEIT